MSSTPHDMDLRELRAALRHGLGWIVGGVAVGILLAVVLSASLPRSYSARATVLLRAAAPMPGAVLAGNSREGIGGLAAALGGSSAFDTELEVLESRAVMEPIVDSLRLQVRVTEPRGVPALAVFQEIQVPADVVEGEYELRRRGEAYRVSGPGGSATVPPGGTVELGGARVTLRRAELPDRIRVRLTDRDPAVTAALKALRVERRNGDVAELRFRSTDSLTAAAVPNALIDGYLARRRTVDRGTNQARYEFLTLKTDSVARDLAAAEAALREAQERSGVVDPGEYGRSQLAQVGELRTELNTVEAEMRALRRMAAGERVSSRELAAFPTLMSNPAITGVLNQLVDLDGQRAKLLQRRTEADPDVLTLDASIERLEGELGSLAGSYLAGLTGQEAELRRSLLEQTRAMSSLPAQSEVLLRLQREVRRLGETYVALQTQLVQLRLAAVGEGGEVRVLDAAVPPRGPAFPNLPISLAVGMLGGLVFGCAAAVGAAQLRRPVREPWQASQIAAAPAVALRDGAPLLLAAPDAPGTVLVLPVGRGANAARVASRVALTAGLQGKSVALVELVPGSDPEAPIGRRLAPRSGAERPPAAEVPKPAASEGGSAGGYLVYRAVDVPEAELHLRVGELAEQFDVVVVAAPDLASPRTAAVLPGTDGVVIAAQAGAVTEPEIEESTATLLRLRLPLLGVVLEPAAVRRLALGNR